MSNYNISNIGTALAEIYTDVAPLKLTNEVEFDEATKTYKQ